TSNDSEQALPALPMYGYSKDHRPDLKQIMLSLTVSGKAQMPIWFEALDGNSQDKNNFHKTLANIKAFREQLKSAPKLTVVADSALYTNDKLKTAHYDWITRIPNQISSVKHFREADTEQFSWIEIDENYRAVWLGHSEKDLVQCNLMVYSKETAKTQLKTLEKQIQEELAAIDRASKKFLNDKMYCKADAEKKVSELDKKIKYHNLSYTLTEVTQYKGKGRPKKDAYPEFSHYQIILSAVASPDKQKPYRNRAGRFLLATNQFDLEPHDFLESYKSQQDVERGFRVIKDPQFHLDDVFLKKPERINALQMIMTLCLMVYNLGQFQFREKLEDLNETILNQSNKPTATPTLRWIFQQLDVIHFVTVEGLGAKITGICEEKKKIIRIFGEEICKIYNIA
ncbi:IS1634 family transposase, partial [Shewanella sp. 202IG2-18]|uniref:IS1634 family transposase n=1 Tax=Parashewanella hymeniacidonis TaxID=2807618 RepID=UPI001961DF60